jgi:two-component system, LytTR family, sensor histidine kinase AlgZ
MHPIFRSSSGLQSYVAVCLSFGLLAGFVLMTTAGMSWVESVCLSIPLVVMLAVACLLPWYACRSLPLDATAPWKLLTSHLIAAMLASAIVPGLLRVYVAGIEGLLPELRARFQTALPAISGMVFLIYLLSVALHYVLLAVESSRQSELLSREAELKALKAQVNPHFLFNCLNSMSALTATDPPKAREMCIRLSEFLRSSLRLGERTSIPFAEELLLTRTYLEVEQVRFGSRLRVTQDFDAGCADCEVPPLLVQPLVENAIKHGIAMLVEGGEISIVGRRLPKFVSVVVENPYDPDSPATRRNGFGLISVRNRLQARYGNRARMDIQVENQRYRVALTLPCDGKATGQESAAPATAAQEPGA